MTDAEALESLRHTICALFPPGPVRERWLEWAERVHNEERRSGWRQSWALRYQDLGALAQDLVIPRRSLDLVLMVQRS